MVFLSAVLGVNANQIHKWCHRTPRENGALIVALQRLHLVRTARQHHRHHLGNKDAAYCVLTGLLNPILDGYRFWRAPEWVVFAVFRIRKRDDDELPANQLPTSFARATIGYFGR